ncbi:class I SAM-dependent DNA methyltransferase [Larkinella sp. GY13]
MTNVNFNTYSKYYDLLYKDKDYRKEANYVIGLLHKFQHTASSILELGSGSGAHAEYFCSAGYVVVGIERSQEMIEVSRQKKMANFKVIRADITDFALERSFDVSVSLFHVLSYLTDNSSLIRTFQLTALHLVEGGLFIFDVWYTPAVLTLKPETRIKRLEDDDVHITRIAESTMHVNRNVVDVNYEVHLRNKATDETKTILETHPMRHFSIPEIELLALHTGFELLRAEEFVTGLPLSISTWGACFVLRKKSA